jgi:hypothetical protein
VIDIWQIGADLDGHLEHGGSLCDVGMPSTPGEHWRMRVAMASLPEAVSKARMARLARFAYLVSETPCTSEAQLRQRWAWSEPGLQ